MFGASASTLHGVVHVYVCVRAVVALIDVLYSLSRFSGSLAMTLVEAKLKLLIGACTYEMIVVPL